MRLIVLSTFSLGLLPLSPAVAVRQSAPTTVCQVARDAAKLIGRRVRVEGYIFDLSSHGFVLIDKRQACKAGQLGLWTQHVNGSPAWHKAFANSLGPKRAILVGTVRWQKARVSGGRNPALAIERVEYLGQRDADLKEF